MKNEPTHHAYYSSPLSLIQLSSDQEALTALDFVVEKKFPESVTPILERACQQLDEYFSGSRKEFDIPLSMVGTPFQHSVWQELLTIPYAQTTSYQQIAKAIGRPKAVRAVGAANGRNPIAIIVPCHRVIGADGSLTGYGGGLWRKEWLLAHERKYSK